MYYPRIDETVTFRRLKNGLPAYVVHKPGYTRKYAMFATRYGGMDLRFRQDGAWQDTPAGHRPLPGAQDVRHQGG